MGFDKKKKPHSRKNRKTKSLLVFDEDKRKDYLTGFKKRKDERRKKAQQQVERMIKEDRRLLRQKMREFSDVKTKSQRLQPDLEELAKKIVTELPEHTVTITDISQIDLAGHAGTRLGLNQVQESESDADNDEDKTEDAMTEALPEPSIHKHDKALKTIRNKIQKTSRHLKHKKQRKLKKTISKKSKQQKKCASNQCA